MLTARTLHTASLVTRSLADALTEGPEVVVTGGFDAQGASLASTEVYDVASDQWRVTSNLHQSRSLAAATVLADGRVLVSGGLNGSGGWGGQGLASSEIFDPGSGMWSSGPSMSGARWSHAAVLLPDSTILVVGATTSELLIAP